MISSSRLFQLVKSLSSSEKRYFRRYALRHKPKGQNLYLQLFIAVDQQAVYDEKALKMQFQGTSFGKSLSFPKSHLYDELLKSLQRFHHERSLSNHFRSDLDKIELLYDRGFPDQGLRILNKSLKRALQHENSLAVLQFLRWKRRITMRMQAPDFAEEIKAISLAEERWENGLALEQKAVRLHDTLYAQVQAVRRRALLPENVERASQKQQLEALLAAPDLTFAARIAIHSAQAHFFHIAGDFEGVHAAYGAAVRAWEKAPLQIESAPARFVRTFCAWLNSKALIRDYSELIHQIQRIRQQQDFAPAEMALLFQNTYNLELFYYLNAGRHQEATALLPDISKGLAQFDDYLSPSVKLSFFYNATLACWLHAQPGSALRWLNNILHFPKGEVRKDIRDFAPLLEKVLHYELSNIGVLESWFRSFKYRRGSEKAGNTLEEALLNLIKGLLMTPEPSSHVRMHMEFISFLEDLSEQPGTSKLGLQELKQWAASRR